MAPDTKQINAPDIDWLDVTACSVTSVTAFVSCMSKHTFKSGSVCGSPRVSLSPRRPGLFFSTLLPLAGSASANVRLSIDVLLTLSCGIDIRGLKRP
jgi:hypothetical protein